MSKKALLLVITAGCFLIRLTSAGPLKEAHVTKIINDVKVVDPTAGVHRASINDVIRDQIALTTGIKSRSELLFEDNTLTRLGPETYFSFKSGTRDLTLEKGTLLLQVPKGLGGAKIHTAAVTAALTGTTIMMEYVPKQHIKVLVLEGNLRLSANGRFGDSLLLQAGKMVIMRADAKRIPDPITVDLKKIIRTSKLVNMSHSKKTVATPLPSLPLIEKEVALQEKSKNQRNLIDTNLVILGQGTNVLLASDQLLQDLAKRDDVEKLAPAPPVTVSSGTDIGPAPTIKQKGKDHDVRTEVRYGSDGHPVSTPIVLNTPRDWTANGGTGKIQIKSNDSVTVNTTLKVSGVTTKHGHGEISIDSRKTTGTAIAINNSAQLLALLNAASHKDKGGKITFTSAGGDVNVTNATVQADQGTVDIRNNGNSGIINLTNATLHGDIVKVGALGANGTLNVGGGGISADSTIKLYAGGSNGTVNFIEDVTLNGNSMKIISAETVTIFDGKTVTVNGPSPVDVFTNNPNYTGWGGNATTTGTFAGKGANTHAFNLSPNY